MKKLSGFQAKYLRSLAHALKPVVFVGQKGITDGLIASTEQAFDRHELIKVKFVDFKEKNQKKEIAEIIRIKTGCLMAGMIGHVAIFYRQHDDPAKRKVVLPKGAKNQRSPAEHGATAPSKGLPHTPNSAGGR